MAETARHKYPLKLPASLKATAARLAAEDGVSLNQWIVSAVAQKVGAVETAAQLFARRAEGADLDAAVDLLRRAPSVPPIAGDELPKGWQSR